MSEQVDKLMQLIQVDMNLYPQQLTELIGRLVSHLKVKDELNLCLRELNSHDWMILYRAVIEVEAGL